MASTTLLDTQSRKPAHIIYRKSVKPPKAGMIKSGKHNAKLGGKVTVKMWQGMPIYQLSLEERATCPTSCDQWENCYGNNMPFAHRYDHTDADFYRILAEDIDRLAQKHPNGFVLRLHVLGDFFNVGYVGFWIGQLTLHPELHIFGFTHFSPQTYVGAQIEAYSNSLDLGPRFRIRFSDMPQYKFSANVQKPGYIATVGKEVICPQQEGKTPTCGSCGLCWSQPDRKIVFLEH